MDRRRAAGLLLALAACIATATAAPTSSNHTSLDLYDGAPDGCYYNFQHYGEGHRIMTNEPCLNCTCHNRMLMCYLRVCPFTKPIGQDCTVEKRADQCCPIVTCPDVPVDLLTSTTTSPAEYGSTGMGKLDKFGCSINGKFFPEGAKVPPTPNKPCEHCYCIRNMTTCVMQECTLHVDGCTPIYHKDVCCPVRYSCDHPEDELPALDDLSTTVRPTPGFLLTTTTISPVTQISQDCVYDNRVFADGALIETEKACDHCYCMKGDIVCVVQACGTPMENEGKNCTALPPREGVCCPDTYICEGDEPTTGTYEYDITTHVAQDEFTTLTPPKRTLSEGSGYRNEPDYVPSTKLPIFEPEVEGSGEEEPSVFTATVPGSSTSGAPDDILATTEDAHEFIPLTTTKSTEDIETTTARLKEDESTERILDSKTPTESVKISTTNAPPNVQKEENLTTEKSDIEDVGSGEEPVDDGNISPQEITITTSLHTTEGTVVTSERNEQDFVTTSKLLTTVTSAPIVDKETTPVLPSEYETATTIDSSKDIAEIATEESATASLEPLTTTSSSNIEDEEKENTDSINQDVSRKPTQVSDESGLESHDDLPITNVPSLDDEFVTTELPHLHEQDTKTEESTEYFKPQQHTTASTPMLEEIEKDTTEYIDQHIIPSDVTQDDKLYTMSTTTSNLASTDIEEKEPTETTATDTPVSHDQLPVSTNGPVYDQPEITTAEPNNIPEIITEVNVVNMDSEHYSTTTKTSTIDDNGRRTTLNDLPIITSDDKTKPYDSGSSTSSQESDDEGATTEPDKGLNTIPSDLTEEESPISPELHKTTAHSEIITTESNLDKKFNPEPDSLTTSAFSDTSASREETSSVTTESSFSKEYDSLTEGQATIAEGINKEVISTLAQDHTKSTESTLDHEKELKTTSGPKYTDDIDKTALPQEVTSPSSYPGEPSTESSITEKELIPEVNVATQQPPHDTSTVNEVDNEILNEPRIPGEGDCLLNGVTYTNDSSVPSSNKCQSGCKCVSSIIKCNPIICSSPPEYMNNCETIYDSSDACCPTYICDQKTETKPPQPHSQMSGTESPVSPPVHCHGDECEVSKDKKDNEVPPESCKSGNCDVSSDDSKIITKLPSSENDPEHSTSHEQERCTNESDCHLTQIKPCDSENCEQTLDHVPQEEPKKCLNGDNCTVLNIPTKECTAGNCEDISSETKKECTQDNCGESDSVTHEKDHEQCLGPACIKNQEDIVTSTESLLEQTSHDDNKESSVMETERTEESIKPTDTTPHIHSHEVTEITEHQEIVTKKSETILDDLLTTISGGIELVTKSETQPESTTIFTGLVDLKETTSTEYITDQKITESVDDTDIYSSPTSIETSTKQHETDIISSDEITTVLPQEIVTQMVTNPAESLVPDTTKEIIEESSTELPITQTFESQVTSKPSYIDGDSTREEPTEQSITEISITDNKKSETGVRAPEKVEDTEISTKSVLEGSTEPSKIYTTVIPETSKSPVFEETTIMTPDEHITQIPPTSADVHVDFTKDVSPIITEPTENTKIEEIDLNTSPDDNLNEPTEQPKSTKTHETSQKLPEDKVGGTEKSQSGEEYHYNTTPTIFEEFSTEPSRRSTINEQELTKSPEEIDRDDTTTKISEIYDTETPKSIVTEPNAVSEDALYTTSKILDEQDTEDLKTTEQQDVTKSHEEIDQEVTTVNIRKESTTKSTTKLENEPEETSELPKKDDDKIISTKVPLEPATELPTFVTEAHDEPNIESIITTTKIINELSTESSKLSTEAERQPGADVAAPDRSSSDSEFEHPKPNETEMSTEEPNKDETSTNELETTETYTPGSTESAIRTTVSDSKIESEDTSTRDKTTSEIPSESQSPQDISDQATTIKQEITTPAATKLDPIIVTPEMGDSEQTNVEKEQTTQKSILDIQTTVLPIGYSTIGLEVTSLADSYDITQSSEKPIASGEDVQEQSGVHNEISEPADELRTTSSETQEITTMKPLETTKSHHEVEIKTESPEINTTPHVENLTPTSHEQATEEVYVGTETPILEENTKTENPVYWPDSTKLTTEESILHETKEPVKPVFVETTTIESDLEINSEIPASGFPETSDQENDKQEVTTPSSEIRTTVFSDHVDQSTFKISTVHVKSTESQVSLASETTTLNEHLIDEVEEITKKTFEPDPNIVTSSTLDHEASTERSDASTSAITLDISITERPENIKTDNPIAEIPIESSSKATDLDQTEITKVPASEIATQEQTTEAQPASGSSAAMLNPTETPMLELDNDKQVTVNEFSNEISEPSKAKPDKTTLEPDSETETSPALASSTPSKHEYPESTSPSLDFEHTEQITTGSVTTERNDISPISHEIVTEIQPPEIQTDTPAVPLDDEKLITESLPEAEHETTLSDIEVVPEISTRPSGTSEEELTTFAPGSETVELTTPSEEQFIPVDISGTDESPEPAVSISVQTEKATPASKKPGQETTAPEDEFILATPKATTELVDDETTSSPSAERRTKPTEKPAEIPSIVPVMSITTTLSTPITTAALAPHMTDSDVSVTEASADSEKLITPISTVHEGTPASESLMTSTSEVPITALPESYSTASPEIPTTSEPQESITVLSEAPSTVEPEAHITPASSAPITVLPEAPNKHVTEATKTSKPETSVTTSSEVQSTDMPEVQVTDMPEASITVLSEAPGTIVPETPVTSVPEDSKTLAPESSVTPTPEKSITASPEELSTPLVEESITSAPKSPITSLPETPSTLVPEAPITSAPEAPVTDLFEASSTPQPVASEDITAIPEIPIKPSSESPVTSAPEVSIIDKAEDTPAPETFITSAPELPVTLSPEAPSTSPPETSVTSGTPVAILPEAPSTAVPEKPITSGPDGTTTVALETPTSSVPESPITIPEASVTTASVTKESEAPGTRLPATPELSVTIAPEAPTSAPELPKPVSTESQPTDEVPTDDEASFPTGGTSGYGQEPDYADEDQTFGPGTCRYGGKVYVSAQQIPRDDPCDFCFCFRSDIICLQQSCPPPIHGCHEEPIQGFCCPRYECPVSMATTVNVTTTTTTTTTTLPPHFPTHSYKGSVQKKGCQVKGQTYKVGDVVRASSGPCLHCTCGGDGQMKCDPKVCTPEPMLRQMIAAAVSAKRRR